MLKGKMACVVAHPDDEVLWSGGILQEGDWTVICCSVPRIDPIRAYKFFDSCETLGVKARLLPFSEGGPNIQFPHLVALELDKYDSVLTHNAKGEYGHLHHRQVHQWVMTTYEGPKYGFGMGEGSMELVLSKMKVERKLKALKCYDHELPYNGKVIPKWEALWHRYIVVEGVEFEKETFFEY